MNIAMILLYLYCVVLIFPFPMRQATMLLYISLR